MNRDIEIRLAAERFVVQHRFENKLRLSVILNEDHQIPGTGRIDVLDNPRDLTVAEIGFVEIKHKTGIQFDVANIPGQKFSHGNHQVTIAHHQLTAVQIDNRLIGNTQRVGIRRHIKGQRAAVQLDFESNLARTVGKICSQGEQPKVAIAIHRNPAISDVEERNIGDKGLTFRNRDDTIDRNNLWRLLRRRRNS